MRWEKTYSPEEVCCAVARHDAIAALTDSDVRVNDLDAIELVVSELVTNSMHHAGTVFTLVVAVEPDRVRIEVVDFDTRPPVLVTADADATSGRGLLIVAMLATAWGWDTATREGMNGKAIWAELDVTGERHPARAPTWCASAVHADITLGALTVHQS
jgi:hypothetical protein